MTIFWLVVRVKLKKTSSTTKETKWDFKKKLEKIEYMQINNWLPKGTTKRKTQVETHDRI